MRLPIIREKIESCLTCSFRTGRLFCDLPAEALQKLEAIQYSTLYPSGARLFIEGQVSRGVFVLCSGRAKLMSFSPDGKGLMRLAEPGDVIGLSAVVSGRPYEMSAETLEPCQVSFIRRDDFLRLLRANGEVCLRVAEHLSNDYQGANEQVRSLALSHTTEEKLARLLLTWCDKQGQPTAQGIRVKLTLTHEELAQMIGASRETVTRLLGDMRRKQIVQVRGVNLLIPDRAALAALLPAE